MNTFRKYCPNVFVAACEEKHEKGTEIILSTKYGKEVECEVVNFLGTDPRDGRYLYSIIRMDGVNSQERAKRKAERLSNAASNAQKRGNNWYEKSHEGRDFLRLAEPIKVGHHSEKRHRALIERNNNRMDNAVSEWNKVDDYESRAKYWEAKTNTINLSMPESIDYYQFELEKARKKHEGLKNGSIPRRHSYSLTYAKKEVNEMEKKYKLAQKLWG